MQRDAVAITFDGDGDHGGGEELAMGHSEEEEGWE
jgi:hypothetical protein